MYVMSLSSKKMVSLTEKPVLEQFFSTDPLLNIYCLGDLDDFFWPRTKWYGLEEEKKLKSVILLYEGGDIPTLLAFAREKKIDYLNHLLELAQDLLPSRFYAHLSIGAEQALKGAFKLTLLSVDYKMGLKYKKKLNEFDTSSVISLSKLCLDEINSFYKQSYPENWFDPRMLDTGHYYGIRCKNDLVVVTGVHVYSEQYNVAALGNIATNPGWRGQGLATKATAYLCNELLKTVDYIGLNVKKENIAAQKCYTKLGFVNVAEIGEWLIEKKEC